MSKDYTKQELENLTNRLHKIMFKLPEFTGDFFRGISDTTQIRTRVAYAYDLRVFFFYLLTECELFKERTSTKDFTVKDLDCLSVTELEKYSEFLNMYALPSAEDETVIFTYANTATGKKRKLSSVRTFYNFYYKKQLISTNPAMLLNMPRLKDKAIIRLDVNEVADLLDVIENGEQLTKNQSKFHDKTYLRDMAIISLMLGTGIRISECVGLNISDFNFKDNSFIVTRKGGNRSILYMPDEVVKIILEYLENDRSAINAYSENDENAMFLSIQRKRMGVRSIEKMLNKYTQIAVPLKKITPHKLRSTFGTNLYKETGDIYLVADVLGHKDVNTTKKHYAAIEEDRRRIAAKVTKLRDD